MKKFASLMIICLLGLLLVSPAEVRALSSLNWQYYAYGDEYTYLTSATSGNFTADGTIGGTFLDGIVGPYYFNFSATDTQLSINYASRARWSQSKNSYNVGGLTIDNGILFTEAIDTITNVSINALTNMSGFSLTNITWDSQNIAIDWEGLKFTDNTRIVLDIGDQAAPIPEPSTMILLGAGLLGLAWYRRKKV